MIESNSPQFDENSFEENEQEELQEEQNDFKEQDDNNESDESLHEEKNNITKDLEHDLNAMQGKVFTNNNVDFNFSAAFYSDRLLDLESIKSIITRDSNHGLTGMKNLGNSCYINTAVQCLSHCIEIVFYFLSKGFENEVNKSTGNALTKRGLSKFNK